MNHNFPTCDPSFPISHPVPIDRKGFFGPVKYNFDAAKRQSGAFNARRDAGRFHFHSHTARIVP